MFLKNKSILIFTSLLFTQNYYTEGIDVKKQLLQIKLESLACDYISKHSETILRSNRLDKLSEEWDRKNSIKSLWELGRNRFNDVNKKYIEKNINLDTCVCREWGIKIYDILKEELVKSYLLIVNDGLNNQKKHLVVLNKFDGELVVVDFRTFTEMLSMKNDINKNRYLYNLWDKDVDRVVLDKFNCSELKSVNDALFLPISIFLKFVNKWMHNPKNYVLIFPDTMNEDSKWPYGEKNKNSVEIFASNNNNRESDYVSDIESKILNETKFKFNKES